MSCSLAPSCFSVDPQTCYLSVYWTFWLLPAAWWICLPVWSAFSGFDPCLSQHPGNLRTPILLNCNSLAWNICLSLLPLFFWELTTEFISAEAFCKLWVTRGFLWIKEGPDIQTMWTTSVYQFVSLPQTTSNLVFLLPDFDTYTTKGSSSVRLSGFISKLKEEKETDGDNRWKVRG